MIERLRKNLDIKIFLFLYLIFCFITLFNKYNVVDIYSLVFYRWSISDRFYPRAIIGTIFSLNDFMSKNTINIVYILISVCIFVYVYFIYKICIKYYESRYLLLCIFSFYWLQLNSIVRFKPELYHIIFLFVCIVLSNKIKDIKLLSLLFTLVSLVGITIHQGYAFLAFPFLIILLLGKIDKKSIICTGMFCCICFGYFLFLRYYMLGLYKSDSDIVNDLVSQIISNFNTDSSHTFDFGDKELYDRIVLYIQSEFETKFTFQFKPNQIIFSSVLSLVLILYNIFNTIYLIKLYKSLNIKNIEFYVTIILVFYIAASLVGVDIFRWTSYYLMAVRMLLIDRLLVSDISINLKFKYKYLILDLIFILFSFVFSPY